MTQAKQTYQYRVIDSILGTVPDEYTLSENEYYRIHSFFVTYSMCGTQSAKKRTFSDYGWNGECVKNTLLGNTLKGVLNLNRNPEFVFSEKDDLAVQFATLNLPDGMVVDVDKERAVIGKTIGANNHLKLFYRIRDGFAHGKFKLRLSSSGTKMVIIQDDNQYNVTARIVIKLDTLLNYVNAIDINGLI